MPVNAIVLVLLRCNTLTQTYYLYLVYMVPTSKGTHKSAPIQIIATVLAILIWESKFGIQRSTEVQIRLP